MQYLCVEGLRALETTEACKLSFEWASRWVRSNFIAYKQTRAMFEKVCSLFEFKIRHLKLFFHLTINLKKKKPKTKFSEFFCFSIPPKSWVATVVVANMKFNWVSAGVMV